MADRLGSRPWQFQGITGRRKGTAVYCPTCGDWHPTHRGLASTSDCPGARDVPTAAVDVGMAAYIPAERLGSVRRQRVRIPFRVEGG